MERPARSKNTPGTDASFDLLARIAVGEDNDDRYPDGTVLIPTDSADASVLISGTIAGRKPIALVMPDGSNIVARPPALPDVDARDPVRPRDRAGLRGLLILTLAFSVPVVVLLVAGAGIGTGLTVGQIAFTVSLVSVIVWGPPSNPPRR